MKPAVVQLMPPKLASRPMRTSSPTGGRAAFEERLETEADSTATADWEATTGSTSCRRFDTTGGIRGDPSGVLSQCQEIDWYLDCIVSLAGLREMICII